LAEGSKGKLTVPVILPRLPAPGSESSASLFSAPLTAKPSASKGEGFAATSGPPKQPSASKGRGRKFNPSKPPAVQGFKWSPNGVGFDCRHYEQQDGKTTERFIAYLGNRKLAELRAQAADREALRELVKVWISERLAEKGIAITKE
jgi:hypothetical protein